MATDLAKAREAQRQLDVLKATQSAIAAVAQVTQQFRTVATGYVAAKRKAADDDSRAAIKAELLESIAESAAAINGWSDADERSALKTALTSLLSQIN